MKRSTEIVVLFACASYCTIQNNNPNKANSKILWIIITIHFRRVVQLDNLLFTCKHPKCYNHIHVLCGIEMKHDGWVQQLVTHTIYIMLFWNIDSGEGHMTACREQHLYGKRLFLHPNLQHQQNVSKITERTPLN